ncbi:MAG: hypothetical protein M1831_004128 [Alyxoria varia]|nr:MAG: hypothetical protein M1831_004128 [Alyxoria varia]
MATYNKDNSSEPNPYRNIPNLNAISSDYDIELAPPDQVATDSFEFDDNLAIFTNANFFDLETGEPADNMQQQRFDMSTNNNISPSSAFPGSSNGAEFSPSTVPFTVALPSLNQRDFNFTGFPANAFPNMQSGNSAFSNAQPPGTSASRPARTTSDPDNTSSPNGGVSSSINQSPSVTSSDLNHPSSKSNKQQSATDLNVSTEEDKRRRNTAASARFRVKKKQREQAMEKTAKEMTDKVTQLEDTISELRKENSLLKGLLTEKMGKSSESKGRGRSESSAEAPEPKPKKRGRPAATSEASNEAVP